MNNLIKLVKDIMLSEKVTPTYIKTSNIEPIITPEETKKENKEEEKKDNQNIIVDNQKFIDELNLKSKSNIDLFYQFIGDPNNYDNLIRFRQVIGDIKTSLDDVNYDLTRIIESQTNIPNFIPVDYHLDQVNLLLDTNNKTIKLIDKYIDDYKDKKRIINSKPWYIQLIVLIVCLIILIIIFYTMRYNKIDYMVNEKNEIINTINE